VLATYRFVLQPVQIGFNNIWEKESIILSSKVNYIWNVLEILINKQIIEPLYMQGPNPLGPTNYMGSYTRYLDIFMTFMEEHMTTAN
jgi:hypothetical protein